MTGRLKQRKNIKRIKKHISESLKTNDHVKVSLQRRLTSADQEKNDHTKRMHSYTEQLIKHARDMLKAAISDVDDHHKTLTEKLKSEIRSLDDASTIMKTRLASLNNAKTNSEAQVFVDLKRGAREVETTRQLQQDVTPSTAGKTLSEFVVREDVEHFLTDVHSLGQITALEQLVENKAPRVEMLGEYDVAMPEDDNTCVITDSCELHDGAILIADHDNECLKKLSKSTYKVTERLITPSRPHCICRISNDEVAVTLYAHKTVQFVNVAGRLRLTRSFKVGDYCRGVVCDRGELFVVCGGDPGNEDGEPEGPGHVEVYDMSGSPLRTIQFDNLGRQLLTWPRRITASANGDKLYICDDKCGVITVDRQGRVLSTFSHDVLQEALGICTVTGDNVLVSGADSHNIVQLGPSGEMVAELLTGKDGIKNPASVRSIRDNSRLIVTEFESNTIRVYSFKA